MSSAPSLLSSDLAFAYVECDIPAGLTVSEWRRVRRSGDARSQRGRVTRGRGR